MLLPAARPFSSYVLRSPVFFTTEKSPERARARRLRLKLQAQTALTLIQPIPKTLSHTKSARVRALFFLFRFNARVRAHRCPSYYMHISSKARSRAVRAPLAHDGLKQNSFSFLNAFYSSAQMVTTSQLYTCRAGSTLVKRNKFKKN